MELRPLARGREDAAPAACRPPRRRVARVARGGRSDARPQRGDRRVSRFRARRQVDRLGRVRGRRRPVRHARHRPRLRARASRREWWARSRPRRPRRVLRGTRRRGTLRAARAGMAELAEPAGAGERQSLGCARVRARCARPGGGGSARDARVVLRAGRARLRGTPLPRSRPVGVRRRGAGRAAGRAARRPVFPRRRRARSRRRTRGGRTRALSRDDRGGAEPARARATDACARAGAIGRRGTRCHDDARRSRRARGGGR